MKTRTIKTKYSSNDITIEQGCGDQLYISQGCRNQIGVGRKYVLKLAYELVVSYFKTR